MSLETELHRTAGAMERWAAVLERLATVLEGLASTGNHPVKLTITGANTGGEATDKVATTPALVKAEATTATEKTSTAPDGDGIEVNPEKIQKTAGEKIAKNNDEKTEVEPETPAQTAATDHDSPAADHEAELGDKYSSLSVVDFMREVNALVSAEWLPREQGLALLTSSLNEAGFKSFRTLPAESRGVVVQLVKAKLAEVKNG